MSNLFNVKIEIDEDAVKSFVSGVVKRKVQEQIESAVHHATGGFVNDYVKNRINAVMNDPDIQELLGKLAGEAMATYTTPARMKQTLSKFEAKKKAAVNWAKS